MPRVKSTAQLRKMFDIEKRMITHTSAVYDTVCLEEDCTWVHRGWEYRKSALNVGFNHAIIHDDARVAAIVSAAR
ncbi:hypothetical protein HOT31_gp082 [Microbacterium phage Hendrix]|uniref:Uncharacterized protein n=1 Tax=Microbacterium phage Hendrix TaxID=2182341 RepID=A0A2U8UUK4_9CAUD|nr:hypothetical protein HOT31_gp082 [Microbacterium phage Hendrix]AWN07753.1 hypothetical protein PBI_HENDRIX_82 [Microbacterium phage Hendrix]